jgi:HK97 family phage major capsid protein
MAALNAAQPGWAEEPLWKQLWPYAQESYASAYRSWLRRGNEIGQVERRALQADSDTLGGYLVMPMQFVDQLIVAIDNLVYLRQWATVFAVPNADSLGAPSLDADPADPTWTSELAIGSEDTTMAFGRRELHPHPLAKYIKVSRKLLRQGPSVEDLTIQRLGYKFAVTEENAYLNGSGAGQPLGVFVASNDGIPTSRDVSTGNTATSIQFDGLTEAKYKLKGQYWPRARWLFHSDGLKQVAKLQDDNGQYIWRESVRVGEPDRLLGFPFAMSEYAPNTFTTGLYVGILGDFSFYWIADAIGTMEMQRLVELYAATNQVGLIGRMESDGMPTLGEAFVRVKLA